MSPLTKDGEWAVCQQRSTGNEGCWCKHSAALSWRSEGKEPSGPCGAAGHGLTMIWLPGLENGPEGLNVEGRKGRTSREKFKTSISDSLQAWWLRLMVAGAAQTHGAAEKKNYIPISLNSHCPEQDHDEKASSPSCFCRLERKEMETTHVKEHPKRKPQELLQSKAEAENPLLVQINLAFSCRLW